MKLHLSTHEVYASGSMLNAARELSVDSSIKYRVNLAADQSLELNPNIVALHATKPVRVLIEATPLVTRTFSGRFDSPITITALEACSIDIINARVS